MPADPASPRAVPPSASAASPRAFRARACADQASPRPAIDRSAGPVRHPGPGRRAFLRAGAGSALGAVALPGLTACGSSGGGVGPDGKVTVELWHGQTDTLKQAIEALVGEFNRTHPAIHVDAGGGATADVMLQKVTAALASGSYPDIAYVFGSDIASIARSPRVLDLTSALRAPGPVPWNDYWPSLREAVTINGRVRAAPALVDSLAVICNTRLFQRAGLALPQPGWSWAEFVDTAHRLTDPSKGVFGTGWPGVGDEDTTWRLWPMVWDLGGEIIAPDGKSIGFAEQGPRALETVASLATGDSVYVDPKPGSAQMYQVFLSGRMGMVLGGPWSLPDIIAAKTDYTVVPLPSYSGRPVTISGPDTWTVFDNGTARSEAAVAFVRWLNAPEQDVTWDIGAGSLPLSAQSAHRPEWLDHSARTVGLPAFTKALESARVRPVHPAYPAISQAVGEAVVTVLLGRSTPERVMRDCTEKADAALLIPR
ncbi:ABC transporter substrate-binding protein [Streptomyces xanthochromogenes]|uniref:ABC transporter substrate-binding protein n=1 Tax=Streptomyces xanthochromogenes TaxID=67384 RepID=UPI0037B61BC9